MDQNKADAIKIANKMPFEAKSACVKAAEKASGNNPKNNVLVR
jgi:hypothetical protein